VLFKAEEMLIKSNLSILEISEMFGFYDQFYFSRRFKERFGISPLKYRNQKHITKAISFWKDCHEDN
jgi:AraC-like DNA-binding protein